MAHEKVVEKRRRSSFPAFLAVGSLVLLLLFLGYYFENCLKRDLSMVQGQDVLGVSNFNSSPSKNPVTNGETFNFTATIVGDQAGALNATVLFDLTGRGVINSNIQGPGACLKLTDSTAVCNNVDVDPNQTINWTVPVTAASNCSQNSPASLTLQTRLVATLVTSTSTATANCVASQPQSTSGANPTNPPSQGGNAQPTQSSSGSGSGSTNSGGAQTGSGNQTGTSNTSQNGNGGQGLAASEFNIADFACKKVNGFPLVLILFILWLLATAYYFVFRRR